jgi:hypothetical protein
MWHIWQTRPSAGPWSEWQNLGGSFAGAPVVAENLDGRLEIFATGQNNAVWHNRQTSPNGGFSGWNQLCDTWMQGSPSVGMNADGRLEVFACSTGLSSHIWQTAPSNGWSDWMYGLSAGPWWEAPSVASNADGRLEIFSIDETEFRDNGTDIGHNWQTAPNSSDWDADSNFLGGIWTGGPVVVRNADGRLEVFARGTDFRVYHIWQIEPNGGWSDWDKLGDWFVTDIGRTLIQK